MPQLPGQIANQCHGPALLDTGLGLSSDALSTAMGSSLLIAATVFSIFNMTTTRCGQGMGVHSVLLSDKGGYAFFAPLHSWTLRYS